MNEVVLITTFAREELLYLCLEAIRRDDPEISIRVYSDRGSESPDLHRVCQKFGAIVWIRPLHKLYGNSWNLLQACEEWTGAEGFVDIVHLIEDDTLIHKGYLAWAREKLSREHPIGFAGQPIEVPEFAAVCGRIGSPHIPNWLEIPCISWNADCLRTALGHLVPEYFCADRKEMQRVLDEIVFPKSKYRRGGAEADGFFLRCVESHNWKTAFPPTPLATHFGFWGYNCPPTWERPKGTFEERIQFCRELLKDTERRNAIFGHGITAKEMQGWDGRTT